MKSHDKAFSLWLDLLRWLAAFEVLLFHVRHRVLGKVHFNMSDAESTAYYALGVVSSLGQPAVIIFFVLSGFLVGGSSLNSYRSKGSFDVFRYVSSRLTRLWIVLIPAFVLTSVLNYTGFLVAPVTSHIFQEIAAFRLDAEGPRVLACNIAFMQTALCVQYGGNAALWSLFNEFWYYVAWPFVMLAIWSSDGWKARASYLAIAIALLVTLSLLQFTGADIALYFSLWLLGVVAALRDRPFVAVSPRAAGALFVLALVFWRVTARSELQGTNVMLEYPCDLIVAFFTTNLILCLKHARNLPKPPLGDLHTHLAAFSFTLYVVHTPVIHALIAVLRATVDTGFHVPSSGMMPFAIYGFVVLACMLFAYLFSLVTERQTGRVRTYLHSSFEKRFS